MNKYIDAEWLKQNFNTVFWSQITKTIDSAPSIDIVRCRECKYYEAKEDWCYWRDEAITADDFCSYGCRSEKPNNCEHITEDGVTCAKYPACDDCLDNPLNKVKGSERLVKGSEKPNNCETCKWWEGNTNFCYSKADSDDHACHYEPKDEPQTERSSE